MRFPIRFDVAGANDMEFGDGGLERVPFDGAAEVEEVVRFDSSAVIEDLAMGKEEGFR